MTIKITISGPASAHDLERNEITDSSVLGKLHGLVEDDVCSDYFDDSLDDLDIQGGQLKIVYDAPRNGLRIVTEYRCPDRLDEQQLD